MANTNSVLRDTLRPGYVTSDTERCPPPDAATAICPTCLDDLLAEEPGPYCAYCTEALAHLTERETAPDLSRLADPDCAHCRGQGETYVFHGEHDAGRMIACVCAS